MVGLDNPFHLVILGVILLLVFGAKRLPEMGRSLGSGLRGFKETLSGEAEAEHTAESAEHPAALGQRAGERSEALGQPAVRAGERSEALHGRPLDASAATVDERERVRPAA